MGDTLGFKCAVAPRWDLKTNASASCLPLRWAPADSFGSCTCYIFVLRMHGFVLGSEQNFGPQLLPTHPLLMCLSPLPLTAGACSAQQILVTTHTKVVQVSHKREIPTRVGSLHLSFGFSL